MGKDLWLDMVDLRAREVNESWGVWESVQSLFLADTDELTD